MAFGRGTWRNCRDQEWAGGMDAPASLFLPPSISWQCLSWWNQVPVPWALSLRSFQDTVQSRGRWRVELVGVSVNHPDLKLRFFCWCEHGVKRNKPSEWTEIHATENTHLQLMSCNSLQAISAGQFLVFNQQNQFLSFHERKSNLDLFG